MKVSLINSSPYDSLFGIKKKQSLISASWPPLGILYKATVLKEAGVEVSILDQPAKGFTIKETVKWVEEEDPDILGFSTYSSSGISAAQISREVKGYNPEMTIIFGGHYATFNDYRILRKYPSVDIIVRGEGEDTIVQLVDFLL